MKLKDIFKNDKAYINLKARSLQISAKTTQERKTFKHYVEEFISSKKWRLIRTGTKGSAKWWKLKRIKW